MGLTRSPGSWILAIILTSLATGFLYLLIKTLSTTPITQALDTILANPWATTALIDFATGLVFSVPFMVSLGPTWWSSVLWTVSLVVFGNPVLVFRVVVLLLWEESTLSNPLQEETQQQEIPSSSSSPRPSTASSTSFETLLPHQRRRHSSSHKGFLSTLKNALLPLRRLSPPTKGEQDRFPVIKAGLWIYSIVALIVYVVYVGIALVKQPVSQGWDYIVKDGWSLTTFTDLLLGVVITVLYILARQQGGEPHGKGQHDFSSTTRPASSSSSAAVGTSNQSSAASLNSSWWETLGLVLALVFLGNGVTCLFMMTLLYSGRGKVTSLREMMFSS